MAENLDGNDLLKMYTAKMGMTCRLSSNQLLLENGAG